MTESLETLVKPRDWVVFQTLPVATMAVWLIATAGRGQLRKYRKYRTQPRGPKNPPVKRTHDPRRPHGSVARLLAQPQQTV